MAHGTPQLYKRKNNLYRVSTSELEGDRLLTGGNKSTDKRLEPTQEKKGIFGVEEEGVRLENIGKRGRPGKRGPKGAPLTETTSSKKKDSKGLGQSGTGWNNALVRYEEDGRNPRGRKFL